MGTRKICIIILVFLFLPWFIPIFSQPEPPSPEEEWYPPVEGEALAPPGSQFISYSSSTPSSGNINAWIADIKFNKRNEFYCTDYMQLFIQTTFTSFLVYVYEWYPPGNTPSGHWLIYRYGPLTGPGTFVIRYFVPEKYEPEGVHTWKIWLFDTVTWSWATYIIRFNYRHNPRASLIIVYAEYSLKIGRQYTYRVRVENYGEVDWKYTVEAVSSGISIQPQSTDISVPAGGSKEITFTLSPTQIGSYTINFKLINKICYQRIEEQKSINVNVGVLKPGPLKESDIVPTEIEEGDEKTFTITFTNTGPGIAKNVQILVVSASGFDIIKGSDTCPDIPSMGKGMAQIILRAKEGGIREIRVKISYKDEIGNSYEDTLYYNVKVLKYSGEINNIRFPALIGEDREYSISLDIYNDGDLDCTYEISISTNMQADILPQKISIFVKKGSMETVQFKLTPHDKGTLILNIKLYVKKLNKQVDSKTYTATVKAVSAKTKSFAQSEIYVNEEGSIEVEVENDGELDLNLIVRLKVESNIYEKEVSLSVGETKKITFDIIGIKEGDLSATIELIDKDTNKVISTSSYTIHVKSRLPMYIGIATAIIAVAIVIVIVYLKIIKKKRLPPPPPPPPTL